MAFSEVVGFVVSCSPLREATRGMVVDAQEIGRILEKDLHL
jgi:hypothetical protein